MRGMAFIIVFGLSVGMAWPIPFAFFRRSPIPAFGGFSPFTLTIDSQAAVIASTNTVTLSLASSPGTLHFTCSGAGFVTYQIGPASGTVCDMTILPFAAGTVTGITGGMTLKLTIWSDTNALISVTLRDTNESGPIVSTVSVGLAGG